MPERLIHSPVAVFSYSWFNVRAKSIGIHGSETFPMKLTRIVLASALVVALGACSGNNEQNENGAATPATTAAPATASTAPATPPPASTAMKPPAASTAAAPAAPSTAAKPAKSSSGG